MSRAAYVVTSTSIVALAATFTLGESPNTPFTNEGGSTDGSSDSSTLDGGTSLDASTCVDNLQDVCAPSGDPGCPGAGGSGGSGGVGGGAAIALFASGTTTTVTLTNGGMFAGFGGNGGPGGPGGGGGLGVTGDAGASVPCPGSCLANCVGWTLDGGAGGTGGTGGNGGQGGGGAGGPRYFYAAVNGAKVDASATTLSASQFAANTAPGAGGLPNGPDGGEGVHP